MRPVSGAGCVCFDVFLTFACNGPQQNMASEQPSLPASQHPGHLRAQATLHSKAKPIGRFISYLMPPFLRPSYRQTSSLGASQPSRGRCRRGKQLKCKQAKGIGSKSQRKFLPPPFLPPVPVLYPLSHLKLGFIKLLARGKVACYTHLAGSPQTA